METAWSWAPATGLTCYSCRLTAASPTVTTTYTVTVTDANGCTSDARVTVAVGTTCTIFVPNAFTPTKQGNRLFRPIPVGVTIEYFRVYNRWGQMVYSSNEPHKGWDGMLNGKMQDPGTFVWMVQGIDFTGKVIFKKGTTVLIR